MSFVILTFSFLLQGILSLYLPFSTNPFSLLHSDLCILALIFIYPIFYKKRKIKKYYVICVLYGLLFDLLYTNTLVIDSLLFLMVGLLTRFLYLKLSDNFINSFLIVFLTTSMYNLFFYFLLLLFKNIHFYFFVFVYKCIGSILLNFIYSFILYIIVSKYKEKIKPSIYG